MPWHSHTWDWIFILRPFFPFLSRMSLQEPDLPMVVRTGPTLTILAVIPFTKDILHILINSIIQTKISNNLIR